MKKLIGVYDLSNNEQCAGIFEDYEEVSNCLGVNIKTIYNAIAYAKKEGKNELIVKGCELVLFNESELI